MQLKKRPPPSQPRLGDQSVASWGRGALAAFVAALMPLAEPRERITFRRTRIAPRSDDRIFTEENEGNEASCRFRILRFLGYLR